LTFFFADNRVSVSGHHQPFEHKVLRYTSSSSLVGPEFCFMSKQHKNKDEKQAHSKTAVASSNVKKEKKPKKAVVVHLGTRLSEKHSLATLAELAKSVNLRRLALCKEKIDFDKKYVVVDSKTSSVPGSLVEQIDTLDVQLKMLRDVARGAFGTKVLKINLYDKYSFSTSAAGLISGNSLIDPSTLPEFSSLSLLFDEYRVLSGKFVYMPSVYFSNAFLGVDNHGVIVYDPIDTIVPTTVLLGLQKEQHQLFFIPSAVLANAVQLAARTRDEEFHWRVPPGIILSSSGSAALNSTSTWQATTPAAGSYYPYGYLKVFASSVLPVSATGVTGFQTYHCEFRCRD